MQKGEEVVAGAHRAGEGLRVRAGAGVHHGDLARMLGKAVPGREARHEFVRAGKPPGESAGLVIGFACGYRPSSRSALD